MRPRRRMATRRLRTRAESANMTYVDPLVAGVRWQSDLPDLVGLRLPQLTLPSTDGIAINLAERSSHDIYVLHPVAMPREAFIELPLDATLQIGKSISTLLAFNDMLDSFEMAGIRVFGVSVQSRGLQSIVAASLGLRFPLLSDKNADLARLLKLPMLRQGRLPRFAISVVEAKMGWITRHVRAVSTAD